MKSRSKFILIVTALVTSMMLVDFSSGKTKSVNAASFNIDGGTATNFHGNFTDGGTHENIVYFDLEENNAPYGDWDVRYTPTTTSAISLERGGVTYNIANTAFGTIGKISETNYFIVDWMFGDYKPYQSGDIITINGTFVYSDGTNNHYLTINESSYEVSSEGVVLPKYEVTINSYKTASISESCFELVVDDDEVPYNSDCTVRYTPLVVENSLTLTRQSVTYQLGKAWSIMCKATVNKYLIDFNFAHNTEVIDFKGFEDGDVIAVNATFSNTIDGINYFININVSYTYEFIKISAPSGSGFFISNNDYTGQFNAFGFKLPENDIPVFDESQNKYLNVEKTTGMLLLRDGNLQAIAKTIGDSLQKANGTDYYLKYWACGSVLPFRADDVIIFGDTFVLAQNNKNYKLTIATSAIKLGETKDLVSDADYKDELKKSLSMDKSIYSESSIDLIEETINNFLKSMDSYKDNEELLNGYNNVKTILDGIAPDPELVSIKLVEEKAITITKINSFANLDNYFENEQTRIIDYVSEYSEKVNNSTSISQISSLYSEFKNTINGIATKITIMQNAILNRESGYEEYLDAYDVVSLHDLFLGESVEFDSSRASVTNNNIYYEAGKNINTDTILANQVNTFARSEGNTNGNVVFTFLYKATSNETNGSAHLRVKLRGEYSFGYIFSFGTGNGGYLINSTESAENDVFVGGQGNLFYPGFTYVIELGAIDLKSVNRTWIFAKVNGEYKTSAFVNSISFCKNASVTLRGNYAPKAGNGKATIYNVETENTNATNVGYPNGIEQISGSTGFNFAVDESLINNDTDLYPIDVDNVKYNGQVISNNGKTILRKQNNGSYLVKLFENGVESFANGDKVEISGRFATFDTNKYIKSAISVSKVTFTYNAETNIWTRDELSLEDLKIEALSKINKKINVLDYEEEDRGTIQSYIDEISLQINNATSNIDVESALDTLFSALESFETILSKYVKAKTEDLTNYLVDQSSNYYEEQLNEINAIKNKTKASILKASTILEVDALVTEAINSIDLVKVKSIVDADNLALAKKNARTSIESLYNEAPISAMIESEKDELTNLTYESLEQIEALTNIDEINNLVSNFKNKINSYNDKYLVEEKTDSANVGLIVGSSVGGAAVIAGAVVAFIFFKKRKGVLR